MHVKVSEDGVFEGPEPLHLWAEGTTQHVPSDVLAQMQSPDTVVVRAATQNIALAEFLDHIALKHAGERSASFYVEVRSEGAWG